MAALSLAIENPCFASIAMGVPPMVYSIRISALVRSRWRNRHRIGLHHGLHAVHAVHAVAGVAKALSEYRKGFVGDGARRTLHEASLQGVRWIAGGRSRRRVWLDGGGDRIRTCGRCEATLVFKTSALNRSATPPRLCEYWPEQHAA